MTDWTDDPDAAAWLRHVLDDVVPAMDRSAVAVSVAPTGEVDVQLAVELGLAILLDKPIVVVVAPGTQVPGHLARVADEIVEADLTGDSPDAAVRVYDAVRRLLRPDTTKEP